jgi:uncharacterized membrane protein YadS
VVVRVITVSTVSRAIMPIRAVGLLLVTKIIRVIMLFPLLRLLGYWSY